MKVLIIILHSHYKWTLALWQILQNGASSLIGLYTRSFLPDNSLYALSFAVQWAHSQGSAVQIGWMLIQIWFIVERS